MIKCSITQEFVIFIKIILIIKVKRGHFFIYAENKKVVLIYFAFWNTHYSACTHATIINNYTYNQWLGSGSAKSLAFGSGSVKIIFMDPYRIAKSKIKTRTLLIFLLFKDYIQIQHRCLHLYTRKLKYDHFTLAFWLHNNLNLQ